MIAGGTYIIAVVTLLAGAGGIFEVGRRVGRTGAESDETETDVKELDGKIEARFSELQQQLEMLQHRRMERERVIIEWLSEIHQSLDEKGADVSKPSEVTEDVDIDIGDRDPDL